MSAEPTTAVIVTYCPKLDALSLLLKALEPQVASIVVVDNGSGKSVVDYLNGWRERGIHSVFLPTNTGVANALNVGIQWARDREAALLLLFDQDSQPAPDMVANLLTAYRQLRNAGIRVGGVGPQQVDSRSLEPTPFMSIDGGWGHRVLPAEDEFLEVDHLITSGCLIPTEALNQVGSMMSELFIDNVDIEWSWRCRAAGFHLYGVARARMLHCIGDRIIRIGGRFLLQHSPLRQYYIVRNTIYLRHLQYAPIGWRRLVWRNALVRLVIFSLCTAPRLEYCQYMLRGIRDGLSGRLGAYSPVGRTE